MENEENAMQTTEQKTKFCKFCGAKIAEEAVLCTACGRQVEELKQQQQSSPSIVINNANTNTNSNVNQNIMGGIMKKPKNKWVSFFLCFFLGFLGIHKFYEGKIGMGIIYLFTGGLFAIGAIIDLIVLLFKPNPYYV